MQIITVVYLQPLPTPTHPAPPAVDMFAERAQDAPAPGFEILLIFVLLLCHYAASSMYPLTFVLSLCGL